MRQAFHEPDSDRRRGAGAPAGLLLPLLATLSGCLVELPAHDDGGPVRVEVSKPPGVLSSTTRSSAPR